MHDAIVDEGASPMSPGEISHAREREREERRLGMRSLDRATIAYHFDRARQLRDAADAGAGLARAAGASGTKGSWGCPPQ